MTLKIEISSDNACTTIKLIGRLRASHLMELRAQIQKNIPTVILDLEQLSLVDIEAVRFLAEIRMQGIRIVQCATYIMDWINIESRGKN